MANKNHMFSRTAFDLMGESTFMPVAIYYRASEDSAYVPVDTAEIVGSGGASLDQQGEFASAEKNVFRLMTTALGDYTLRCTVDGTTYEQPLRVQLPDTGLFTEGAMTHPPTFRLTGMTAKRATRHHSRSGCCGRTASRQTARCTSIWTAAS